MDYSSTSEKCEDLSNINEHLKQKIAELEKEKDELKVIFIFIKYIYIYIYFKKKNFKIYKKKKKKNFFFLLFIYLIKEKNFEQANIISNIDLDARQLLIDSIQV